MNAIDEWCTGGDHDAPRTGGSCPCGAVTYIPAAGHVDDHTQTDALETAAREWIWQHSSQPNGDPWDGDPEHLNWVAGNLISYLRQWFPRTEEAS